MQKDEKKLKDEDNDHGCAKLGKEAASMLYYKTVPEDDPYNDLWNSPEWLFPFENKDKLIFPKILTVEPVNICQNECIYCGMRLMNRKTGFMTAEIMKKIADEAALYECSIRFGGFGEPLIHKEMVEFARICKDRKVRATIFTNAKLLNEDMMKAFCEMGLDEIRISSAGISEAEHKDIRRNSDWNKDFLEKILMADRIKRQQKADKPYLTLHTCVFDYDKNDFKQNVDIYVKHFLRYVDKVNIDLINLCRVKDLEKIRDYYPRSTIREIYKPCVTLYHKMLIHWNGDVFACDLSYNYDERYYCGNIRDKVPIYEMYHSEKVKKLREMTESLQHAKLPHCKECFQSTYKYEELKEKYKKEAVMKTLAKKNEIIK